MNRPLGINGLTLGSRSRAGFLQAGFGKMGRLFKSKGYAMKTLLSATLIGAFLASPALALEPIGQNKTITGKLVAARVADRIRRECDSIDARIIYAFGQARALKSDAEKQGYSTDQIDAFLDSKSEKARIYASADAYLAKHGATPGDGASYCRLGRDEIAAQSFIGSFLRVR